MSIGFLHLDLARVDEIYGLGLAYIWFTGSLSLPADMLRYSSNEASR
jgi:hypothetical protein